MTIRDRLADLVSGRRLGELEQNMGRLQEINQRLLGAYQEGVYELPPAELARQLSEYDPALVQDLVDQLSWEAVGGYGGANEDERQRAVKDSRRMFKYSILARWMVNLWTFYGLGESLTITPEDEPEDNDPDNPDPLAAQEVWSEFWNADRNQAVIAKDRIDEISRWLLVTGERFFSFFASDLDGETTIRSIQPEQITNVYSNPDDACEPWFYERRWVPKTGMGSKTLYYPDWQVFFDDKVDKYWTAAQAAYPLGGELAGQNHTAACLLFVPFLQLDEDTLRGWPLLAPHGTPWIRAQREFMQDRMTVVRGKASYIRRYSTAGGSRAVDAVRRTLGSAFQFGSSNETNPPPAAGSSEVMNKAITAEDLPMTTGAGDAKTDGEMVSWIALLAGGLFPHYAGMGDSYRLATACYSDDTEVLTEHGWKNWWDVKQGERIATYYHGSPLLSRTIEYLVPTALHVYEYEGEMLSIKGRGVDCLVTPNHRMLALNENNVGKEWAKTEFEVIRAEDLPSRFALPTQATVFRKQEEVAEFTLPGNLYWSKKPDRTIPMDDWLQFLGWWLSEGTIHRRGYMWTIAIHQGINSPNVEKIDSLLARLPFSFDRGLCNGGHGYRWRTSDKALYTWLLENCGEKHGKHLPALAFNLSARQSRVLLDALWDGDGHWEESPHYRGFYTSTAKELIDGVQVLMLNASEWGHLAVNREENAHPDFETSAKCWVLHRNVQAKRSLERDRNVTAVPYNGPVWCFEAPPNGMFITRRNGCPLIAGNTAMERPEELQFSLYRQQLSAMFRKMVRIVLQFKEKYGGVQYDTYEADVSTDRLVEVDLELVTTAVGQLYRDVLATASIPAEARRKIDVYTIQTVLQALGATDVQKIINDEMYPEEPEQAPTEEPGEVPPEGTPPEEVPPETPPPVEEVPESMMAESHIGQAVERTCPLCGFYEATLYPEHKGLLVCNQCHKTYDPGIE